MDGVETVHRQRTLQNHHARSLQRTPELPAENERVRRARSATHQG